MKNVTYDVTGIGNAIVDVLSFCDDAFIAREKLPKGGMTLIDAARSADIYGRLGQTAECSGGSVANTMAGMASLGAKCAFIGKVAGDQLGSIFTHDLRSVGVHFDTKPTSGGPSTANCLVMVTQDAQRTMGTYIGACSLVSEEDIDETLIKNAAVTYVEGYLWDMEGAKAAIRKAMRIARAGGHKVAFTLSDPFCVERFRDEFLHMIENSVNILFANEKEITSLFRTKDFKHAIDAIRGRCEVAVITRSEKGCVIVTRDSVEEVPGEKVANVVDTTGAGDLFASGFLYGFTRGRNLRDCAALGNRCGAHIITQLGARSMMPLKSLVA